MDELKCFPFHIGQRVESKSNVKGYRGAWFRGEIKDIQLRKDEIWCALLYVDFPDEKVSYTKVYQQDLGEKKKRALMIRPSFPSVSWKADHPDSDERPEVMVVIDEWRVGNNVDWWSDGCYWMAKVTEILSKDSVQIELPKPPVGEGGSYKADVKDIRPSLHWSIHQQWTIPSEKAESNLESFSLVGQLPNHDVQFEMLGRHLDPYPVDAICSLQKKGDPMINKKGRHLHDSDAKKVVKTVVTRSDNIANIMDERTKLKRKSSYLQGECLPEASEIRKLCNVFWEDNTDNCSFESQEIKEAKVVKGAAEQEIFVEVTTYREHQYSSSKPNDEKSSMEKKSLRPNGAVSQKDIGSLMQELKCANLEEDVVGSSVIALEELVSRVIWLKGVLQLGLKGWHNERNKKKWTLC